MFRKYIVKSVKIFNQSDNSNAEISEYVWQYGLWSFQMGDKKLEIYVCLRINLPKEDYSILEFQINGDLSNNAKI